MSNQMETSSWNIFTNLKYVKIMKFLACAALIFSAGSLNFDIYYQEYCLKSDLLPTKNRWQIKIITAGPHKKMHYDIYNIFDIFNPSPIKFSFMISTIIAMARLQKINNKIQTFPDWNLKT